MSYSLWYPLHGRHEESLTRSRRARRPSQRHLQLDFSIMSGTDTNGMFRWPLRLVGSILLKSACLAHKQLRRNQGILCRPGILGGSNHRCEDVGSPSILPTLVCVPGVSEVFRGAACVHGVYNVRIYCHALGVHIPLQVCVSQPPSRRSANQRIKSGKRILGLECDATKMHQ